MRALLQENIIRIACVPLTGLLHEIVIRIACVPFFSNAKMFSQTNSNNSHIQMVVCIDFRI
jgi:hypothetical protein